MTTSSLPIPETRLLWLLALWLLLGIAAVPWPKALPGWQAWGAAALALAVADGYAGRRRRGRLTVTRKLARTLPVGSWQTIGLKLSASGPVAGWLRDRHPATFRTSGLPSFDLAAGNGWKPRTDFTSRPAVPKRFPPSTCVSAPPGALVHARNPAGGRHCPNLPRFCPHCPLHPCWRPITGFPNGGILNRRRRAKAWNSINCATTAAKIRPPDRLEASARLGKLISREFQDQRDQQVVFLLDCGSHAGTKDGDLSHFDHTPERAPALAYVALNQGDAVGLLTFGHASPRYIPPRKSVATVNRLLNAAVYDLQPTHQAPRLSARQPAPCCAAWGKSLVIVLTNLRDEDADTPSRRRPLLARRHTVTIANLREDPSRTTCSRRRSPISIRPSPGLPPQVSADRQRQAAHLRHGGIPCST